MSTSFVGMKIWVKSYSTQSGLHLAKDLFQLFMSAFHVEYVDSGCFTRGKRSTYEEGSCLACTFYIYTLQQACPLVHCFLCLDEAIIPTKVRHALLQYIKGNTLIDEPLEHSQEIRVFDFISNFQFSPDQHPSTLSPSRPSHRSVVGQRAGIATTWVLHTLEMIVWAESCILSRATTQVKTAVKTGKLRADYSKNFGHEDRCNRIFQEIAFPYKFSSWEQSIVQILSIYRSVVRHGLYITQLRAPS